MTAEIRLKQYTDIDSPGHVTLYYDRDPSETNSALTYTA